MKIMFVAYQCYLDPSNGATHSMRDVLRALSLVGWECHVFCGPIVSHAREVAAAHTVLNLAKGRSANVRQEWNESRSFSVVELEDEGVKVQVHLPATAPTYPPKAAESRPFLAGLRIALQTVRPDVVIMFGREEFGEAVIAEAKAQGAAVVFALCNYNYLAPDLFAGVDAVLVPSDSMAKHYRNELGLDPTTIPPLLNETRVVAAERTPTFLTYVSPCPVKGLHLARHILCELNRRRPEIPILLVEGRGDRTSVHEIVSKLPKTAEVQVMPTVLDARQFYASTRVLLMPSIAEPFGMLGPECFINGIPIVAGRRDGLIEACREGGILIDIPARYTEYTTAFAPADVEPWVDVLLRLWDDPEFHASETRRGVAAARAFSAETLVPKYAALFESAARKASLRTSS